MKKKSSSNGTGKFEALEDLRRAFETAESSSPGFSEAFLRETLSRLLPTVSDARIKATVTRMARYSFDLFNTQEFTNSNANANENMYYLGRNK